MFILIQSFRFHRRIKQIKTKLIILSVLANYWHHKPTKNRIEFVSYWPVWCRMMSPNHPIKTSQVAHMYKTQRSSTQAKTNWKFLNLPVKLSFSALCSTKKTKKKKNGKVNGGKPYCCVCNLKPTWRILIDSHIAVIVSSLNGL